jgi:hypothetical protein
MPRETISAMLSTFTTSAGMPDLETARFKLFSRLLHLAQLVPKTSIFMLITIFLFQVVDSFASILVPAMRAKSIDVDAMHVIAVPANALHAKSLHANALPANQCLSRQISSASCTPS